MIHYSIEWPKREAQLPSPSIERWIFHYKGIFIINNLCCIAFGTILVPFLKTLVIIGFILCFFACVRLFNYLDLISLAFVVAVSLLSAGSVVPMALAMSSMYDISQTFSQNVSNTSIRYVEDRKAEAILKKQLKSCAVIRFNVGGLYHMEAKAKLTMVHHVVNGIVFLLVNAKRN